MIEIKMFVKLSRSELLSFNPCKEGLDLFDRIAPNGSIEIEWADTSAIALVKANPFGPWLDQKGLIPPLRSVNWKKADLSGAYLTGANLIMVNLTGAKLSRANLTGANLFRANLTGADLTGADLTGAYLGEAIWNQKFPVPSGWKLTEDRLIRA